MWEHALNPLDLAQLAVLKTPHRTMALRVYEESITLVRDNDNYIPLSRVLSEHSTVASASASGDSNQPRRRKTQPAVSGQGLFYGEDYFQELGRQLASYNLGNVMHTSYTSYGVRIEHEKLVERADTIIIMQAWLVERFDYVRDREPLQEFLRGLLETDDAFLFGRLGDNDGDDLDDDEDAREQDAKVANAFASAALAAGRLPAPYSSSFSSNGQRSSVTAQHFVIRNTSTGAIYGFASALAFPALQRGCLSALLVDPEKRGLAMGRDLHTSVVHYLTQAYGVDIIQLGAPVTAMFPGVPLNSDYSFPDNVEFFEKMGWNLESGSQTQRLYSLLYKQTPNNDDLNRSQVDTAAKGLVLELHAPWEEILAFVEKALKLPKMAIKQPFARLIYQEAAMAAMAAKAAIKRRQHGGIDGNAQALHVVAITTRERSSGAIVGSALLIRHDGSSPDNFAGFHFPHPCRNFSLDSSSTVTTTSVFMCPIVVPQQYEPVDFHKTVVRGLAAKAIIMQKRDSAPPLFSHTLSPSPC
ncbi:hypothetical protein SEUCBS139899_001403 [Sporothrix eucalyptigena]